MADVVPMRCRALHDTSGALYQQPYGTAEQAIYSVSRTKLNAVLLDAAEEAGVDIAFGASLIKVDGQPEAVLELADGSRAVVNARAVFGADGAYSRVRSSMMRLQNVNLTQHYINHGYKELHIQPSPTGGYALDVPEALHIWPRHDFMMIALPNPDKTFTCTLFAPYATFKELDGGDPAAVRDFFNTNFSDAVPLLGDVAKQFAENPTSSLVTMRVKPWNFEDKLCVIGDAAHAVVPFYGQGMNCAAEDALSFDEVLGRCGCDLGKAIPAWAAQRQPAGDGLADLSYGNYVEMRSHTANPGFLLQKKVESWLHYLFPDTWIPQYTMVAFTRIPYHEAKERADRQDVILKLVAQAITLAGAASVAAAVGLLATKTQSGRDAISSVKQGVSSLWGGRASSTAVARA
jgi:kynurenine 3-monooxygenase